MTATAHTRTKILHLIDTGGPGGAETVFRDVASGLQTEEFEPCAVVSRDDWLAGELRRLGIEPVILRAQGGFNVRYLRALVALARSEQIDLICTHLLGSAVYGSLTGLICRKPVVCVFHGQTDISSGDPTGWLKRAVIRRAASKVIFVSDTLRRSQGDWLGLPADRAMTIHNGVDFDRFKDSVAGGLRQQLGFPQNAIVAGAVGNIRSAKDYATLLRASAIIHARHPDFRLVIAGEGTGGLFESLLALRIELGLESIIHFLGLREDIPEILNSLDLYLLSSSTEGFSIACVEAMACGLPIVATRSGGPEEIFTDQETGLLVPPKSPETLAEAACRVIKDKAFARQLGSTARAQARTRFSREQMLASYADLFREVMGRKSL